MESFFQQYSFNGNWIDLVFFGVLAYFIFSNRGFIHSSFEVVGFILSLLLSYKTYSFFGNILIYNFNFPKGIANAIGFFISYFLFELFFFTAIAFVYSKVNERFHKHPLNKWSGVIPASFQAGVLFLVFISMAFALPIRGQVKQSILDSRTGPFFVNASQSLESNVKTVFGGAVSETLNFLTIKPNSGETVELGFKVEKTKLSVDENSEELMLELLNKERVSRGLNSLKIDPLLQKMARNYGEEMFINGFFAHTSKVDGSTPADRADRAGVEYFVIGENLAFAPDVYLAHQGLMNSQGHRENILSPEYGRVGIGVVDGGIYGKMFVQNFAD